MPGKGTVSANSERSPFFGVRSNPLDQVGTLRQQQKLRKHATVGLGCFASPRRHRIDREPTPGRRPDRVGLRFWMLAPVRAA